MPNRKLFIHKTVIAVSFRTEEGLPLPATPYIKVIIESILARAQTLYHVTLCHYLVMANHLHLLLVVEDPGCVPLFIGYLKGETAHAVNHLLGRNKHTIWADGYDSPTVLDAAKAADFIEYLYRNPQKANLVERIEDYPHLSTWEAFLAGGEERTVLRIPRESIPALTGRSMSLSEQDELATKLMDNGREECRLIIEPDAWMNCFIEFSDKDPEQINEQIVANLRANEEKLRKERVKPVMGAHALKLQPITKDYAPKKRGKRMLCLSSIKALRVAFIEWFREHANKAIPLRQATDWLHSLPPGLFAPGGAMWANLCPFFVPNANTFSL